MFSNELVFLEQSHKCENDFLNFISDELLKKGYVKESFKDAIINREKEYPTGIGTEIYNLAIPHTDTEHVNKSGIAFVKFNNKCEFKEMCTNNNLNVDMAFVLLVTKKEEQVVLLSKLMGLFSNNEFLEQLYNEKNESNIVIALNKEIL